MAIGEADGGSDISLAGIAAVVEEAGRHALPSPLIPTLSASLVLRAAGSDAARAVMARIAGQDTLTFELEYPELPASVPEVV